MVSQRSWQGIDLRGYRRSRCLLIFFVFLALPLSATTYYVDCNGANSNNETSMSTPWQAIAKVNGSPPFSPGNIILFKAGCTWREQLTVTSSGSPANPIRFGAYGTGAAPIISGADLLTSWATDGSLYYSSVSNQPSQAFRDGSVVLELLARGKAPAAIVLGQLDAIIGIGIVVAAELGIGTIPLLELTREQQIDLHNGDVVQIEPSGRIARIDQSPWADTAAV